MLGELQSIYNVKTGLSQKLNKIRRGLTVEDPDEVGPRKGLMNLNENSGSMPESVMRVVETPSSLANDSQLHQLLSNMHNHLKDMEGGSDEDEDDQGNTIDDEIFLAQEIAERNEHALCDESQDRFVQVDPSNKRLNNSL